MKVLNGLFLGRESNNSLLIYEPGIQIKFLLKLNKPWIYFPFLQTSYFTPIRIINPFLIEENEYETTPDTLIIINPDILINSRSITSASECPRRTFVDHITGEDKISLPMVRGSILHDAFSSIITKNIGVQEALNIGLDKFSFILSYLSVDLKELITDISYVLHGLSRSASTLRDDKVISEMTFLSPLFGVMGRTDYWSPKGIYEFKTGRKIPSKTINTWFSDLIQTIVYMHGLSPSPKAVSKSYVIYSGEGTPVFRKTTLNLDLLQRIYMARNYCYLIQFEGFIPPRRHNKKCSHCFNLKECEILSVFFNNEKNAKSSRFQYLSHFLSLIRLEHLKNRHDFSYLWKLSPQGRVRIGKAINDISFNKKENERFIFRCNNSSELKAGEPVILSKGNPVIDVTTIATIASINRKEISLNSSSSLPEKAYIDAYSSDFSFRRLNKSLYDLILGHKSTHKSQRFIINGKKPTFTHVKALEIDGVDPSQKEAIQLALSANDFCLIQGPAGTGKTYTIAKLVEILLVKGQTILLSAYTNTAVDNMIRKFLEITNDSQARNKIVRLGIEEAIDPEVIDLSLQAKKLEYQDLLKIPIIAATTSTIGRNIYDEFSFDVIIVDEASQMSEPSVLSAVTKGKKFILVGDDKQLPPLVQSTQAEKLGFKNSLFERLRKLWPSASILLRYQYRMHDYLMDFSNIRFYNNSVQAVSQKVGTQLLWDLLPFDTKEPTINPIFQTIIDPNQPLIYIGVPSEFDRKKRVNEKEAEIIKTITRYYIQMGIKKEHIGIIAPFRGQVAEISRQMGNKNNIVVDTVDRFQGSDKELIILSLCTLSPPHLLEDERRLNVALTRAKKKMIIVGDIPTEQSIPIFKELFDHIHEKYSVILIGTKKFKDVTMESRDKRKMIKKTSIEADFSHQSLSKEDLNKEYTKIIKHNICVFCQEPVLSQYILRCPICNQAYHEEHIREWLENNDVCATCQSRIKIILLQKLKIKIFLLEVEKYYH